MAHNLRRILIDEEGDAPTDSADAVQVSMQDYFLPQFSDVVPRLRKVIETTPDTMQRILAAEALVLWGDLRGKPLALLIERLTSGTRREELLAAIQALGHIGPPAAAAIQPLLQILSDSDPEIRSTSMQALLLIRPEPDPAGFLVDSLLSNELDGNEAIRLHVGLGRPVVTQLVQKLRSERNGERFLAVKALSQIGCGMLGFITGHSGEFRGAPVISNWGEGLGIADYWQTARHELYWTLANDATAPTERPTSWFAPVLRSALSPPWRLENMPTN